MCCQSLRKAMCESLRFFDHFKAFCFLTEVWVVYASACNMGCCQRSELWSLIFTSGITIRHVLSQSWSDWKVDVAWHFKQWRCTCWFSSVVTRVLLAVPAGQRSCGGRAKLDIVGCAVMQWQKLTKCLRQNFDRSWTRHATFSGKRLHPHHINQRQRACCESQNLYGPAQHQQMYLTAIFQDIWWTTWICSVPFTDPWFHPGSENRDKQSMLA